MISLQRRPATFATFSIDIYPWLWSGAAVILTAACLIVFGTRLQEDPVRVTRVGDSVGSVADRYVELRRRVEATLPALRLTNDPAEILVTGKSRGYDVRDPEGGSGASSSARRRSPKSWRPACCGLRAMSRRHRR